MVQNNKSLTLLIIDDSEMNRKILKHGLQKWNYHFFEAENGESALELIESLHIDLILIDQVMPGLSGLETFEQIKKLLPFYPPVIMLTSQSDLELAVTFLRTGGSDFIQKPVNSDVLHLKIHRAIEAEKRVQDEKDRLRQLLDYSPMPNAIADEHGMIVYINQRFVELFGYTLEDIPTVDTWFVRAYPDPQYRVRVIVRWQVALDKSKDKIGKIDAGEFQVTCKNGTVRIVEITGTLIDGKTFSVFNDITKRKEAEIALKDAKKIADRANKSKSDFLASMSHELRTPLNGILGYAQVLKRDKQLTDTQRKAVDIIHHSGDHLLLLINDILDLSKIEARRMDLEPIVFHFPSFIYNLIEMIRIRAKEKGLGFEEDITFDLPANLYADEKRLRQILLNLLSNAVKFTSQGTVLFRVQRLSQIQKATGDDDKSLSKPTVHLRFEVKDQGIGIPHEQLDKIFIPFHQIKNKELKEEGTGLGLSISQKLVGLMNSKIEVKSTLGQGSTFWFDLEIPIILDGYDSSEAQKSKIIIGVKGNPKKVLIVDNNDQNRSLLRDLLVPLGFTTLDAINGKDALEKAKEWQPDVIFLDLVMPVMDGFAAAKHIRQQPSLSRTVIIAISASVLECTCERSIEAGCNDYLSKPIQVNHLLQKLQKHLKLEWVYESAEASKKSETMPPKQAEMIPPSQGILAELLVLANRGDVLGIQEYAEKMITTDLTLLPFSDKIKNFADSFMIDELQSFIKKYMEVK
ncbi:MAG: response regulator [Desulfobacterales bacterium]|nr:response regulator [Desulfobacterales bacterium]